MVAKIKHLKNNIATSATDSAIRAAHSTIGASSAYRWFECPGSIRMIKGLPEITPSSYALEGTRAHEYFAKLLTNEMTIKSLPSDLVEPLTLAFDIVRTQLAAARYNDMRVAEEHRGLLLVEKSFDLSHIYDGCYGTADVVILDKYNHTLTVIDYKHGQGISVDVVNNKQLLYYGLGAFTTLADPEFIHKIYLQIIQPRIGTEEIAKTWEITPLELFDFALELRERAEATTKEDAPLKSGDHCKFCPAASVCPELSKLAMLDAASDFAESVEVVVGDEKETLPAPGSLEEFQRALKWVPRIQAWVKAVQSMAYRKMVAGEKIPGFKLVEKRATRKWIDPNEMVTFLQKYNFKDEEIYEPRKVKSPAQIEKGLNKTDQKLLQNFIVAKSSGLTLVEESDRRPEVTVTPGSDFEDLVEEELKQLNSGENE